MEYTADLLESLQTGAFQTECNGVTVECRVAADTTVNRLDPRQAVRWQNQQRRNQSGGVPTLEQLRDTMGCFNYNLCKTEIHCRHLLVDTSAGQVPVWGYFPRRGRQIRPALVYVHGGGFFGGSPFSTENACRLIAERADAVVWNVEYSLAPEHPYPTSLKQVYEVISYLHSHAALLGMDPDRLVIAGDSAGGNLCAAAVMMDRDLGNHCVRAQVLIYPKLIFTNRGLPGYTRDESAFRMDGPEKELLPGMIRLGSDPLNARDAKMYVQDREALTHPYISPPFGNCAGLPETLLILAEYDGLRLEGEFYAGKLQKASVPVRVIRYCGMCHGFFGGLGILPQAEAAVNDMVALLNRL